MEPPARDDSAMVGIAIPMIADSVFQLAAAKLGGAFEPQAWTRPA